MHSFNRHLIFAFNILISLAVAPSCLALECAYLQRLFEHQYTTSEPVGIDLGVLDIGSSGAKLYLKKGSTGEVFTEYYPIKLGESLGRNGGIDEASYQTLMSALQKAKADSVTRGFEIKQIDAVATAGIRDASNGAQILKHLRQTGFSVRVLSEAEESKLVYRSIIRDQLALPKGAVVIEVGGGSTEIVQGLNRLQIDPENSRVLHSGSGSIGIKDPFNENEIQHAVLKVRAQLKENSPGPSSVSAPGFIGRGLPMRTLRDVHLERTGADLFETGLLDPVIDFYLSPEGLRVLRNKNLEPLKAVPSKLLILREVKNHYRLPSLSFGAAGGMKEALVRELEAKTIAKKIDRISTHMMNRWIRSEPSISDKLTELFDPEDFGKWEFRVKDSESLKSKLTSKWLKKVIKMDGLSKTSLAHRHVGDGIGSRLTLSKTTPEDIRQFYFHILEGAKSKGLRITEIHNYRAPGGIPYFSDVQVEHLADVIQKSSGKRPLLINGAEAEKPSGYTGIHFNLVDQKGVQLEMQVRGRSVSRLAQLEHDFYDIRQGKPVPNLDPQLVSTVKNLSGPEQQAFLYYIRDCYLYTRKQELNLHRWFPKLPKILASHPDLSLNAALNEAY